MDDGVEYQKQDHDGRDDAGCPTFHRVESIRSPRRTAEAAGRRASTANVHSVNIVADLLSTAHVHGEGDVPNARDRTPRSTYRHGDLYQALLKAGLELARDRGPTAVAVREATRRAGVSPTAAYRHFADRKALLDAVCSAAQSALANAIEHAQGQVPHNDDRAVVARARFRAVGAGYLEFARAEPNLFRTAFSPSDNLMRSESPARAGERGMTPFQLLAAALDDLVEAGELSRERRAGAEFLAWSAVHGLAMLAIEGPLRGLGPAQISGIAQRLLDMVDQGL
jgi:AcrR family transcriptional regulator